MENEPGDEIYDVVIVGGGPAGLSAALNLGRARRRVLLCDAGPPRNAAAVHIHGFVTRDGTPPAEFRRIAREQLAPYRTVSVISERVEGIGGEKGAFEVRLAARTIHARRILLCTGMIDELPDLEGYRALWGKSIFQCPYCHGFEVQDRRFGVLATTVELLEFSILLRSWTSSVMALTDGRYPVPPETAARLASAGVGLEERRIARLTARDDRLQQIELLEGPPLALEVLFARPPQRQVPLVASLGLELDPMGYVRVDERSRETSRPGIYAGGDLVTPVQAAVLAAASAMLAVGGLNHGLAAELATSGALP